MVFHSISSNIDEVLSINPSANVSVFEDFHAHHQDWLTYTSRTDRPDELCFSFSVSNDLTQLVNFPTQITECDSHSPALLDLFPSSDASNVPQWLSLDWEILVLLLFQFPLTFSKTQKGMILFFV